MSSEEETRNTHNPQASPEAPDGTSEKTGNLSDITDSQVNTVGGNLLQTTYNFKDYHLGAPPPLQQDSTLASSPEKPVLNQPDKVSKSGSETSHWGWLMSWTGRLVVLAVIAMIVIAVITWLQPAVFIKKGAVKWMIIDSKSTQMVLIPAGTFQMGWDADDALAECQKYRSNCQRDWFTDEEPIHNVFLSAFYMDIYEVTNAQYAECVAAGECSVPSEDRSWTHSNYYGNPTYDDYPVIYVSWYQASEYCTWRGGRLPAEAEWEYAARGGLEGMMYPWGDESPVCTAGATNGANCSSCSPDDTVAVGAYAPNGYGLYDMAGNVWEWVSDWYGDYPSGTVTDPTGPSSGTSRVLRGGSWNYYDSDLRVTDRDNAGPDLSGNGLGFRCVASITSAHP